VLLLEAPEVITKKIKRAVTDTETEVRFDPETKPGVSNLLTLLSVATDTAPEKLAESYEQYGPLKNDAAAAVVEFLRPVRQRFDELSQDQAYVLGVLREGAEKAGAVAAATYKRAADAIGLLPA
jgi:tryptophanyl-tRNA synthetase